MRTHGLNAICDGDCTKIVISPRRSPSLRLKSLMTWIRIFFLSSLQLRISREVILAVFGNLAPLNSLRYASYDGGEFFI